MVCVCAAPSAFRYRRSLSFQSLTPPQIAGIREERLMSWQDFCGFLFLRW
jgi:hypothetical protein